MNRKPSVSTLSVRQMLNSNTYAFPGYQRPYSWMWGPKESSKPSQARQLMDDLWEHFVDQEVDGVRFYNMNLVALWHEEEDEGPIAKVVDGQQRLLTLWMLFSAGAELYGEWKPGRKFPLATLLGDDTGERVNPRFRMHNRKALLEIVDCIALGSNVSGLHVKTPGAYAMRAVRTGLTAWLRDKFGEYTLSDDEKAAGMMSFMRNIADNACFFSADLMNEDDAMEFYRIANGRGLSMSDTEHVRYMFYRALSAKKIVYMDKMWEDIQHTLLNAIGKKSEKHTSRVLEQMINYYLIAETDYRHKGKGGATSAFRKSVTQLLRPEGKEQSSERNLQIVRDIEKASGFYANLLGGKDGQGNHNHDVASFRRLNPNFGVHLIALFPGRHLDADGFRRLARALSDWAFVVQTAKVHRSKYDAVAVEIAHMLKEGKYTSESVGNCERRLREVRHACAEDFLQGLRKVYQTLGHQLRVMRTFALCRAEDHIRQKAGIRNGTLTGDVYGVNDTAADKHARKSDYHLDHVMAQALAKTDPTMEGLTHSLGNLTLILVSDNTSIQAKHYEDKAKQAAYVRSQSILTRSMVDNSELIGEGTNVCAQRALRHMQLGPFEQWGSAEVTARTEGLVRLVCDAFDMPFQEAPTPFVGQPLELISGARQ